MPRGAVATKSANFTEEDAYKTWRVLALVRDFTGTTEGFGFSNGVATVSALPKTAQSCGRDCWRDGDTCRVHERVIRLNNLRNYPRYRRVLDERTNRRQTLRDDGYRVLSEAEYESEFGDIQNGDMIDLDDF